ncbi:MAG: hypothetical protein ACC652_05605 [Acidimicrobiales bacterium]
MTVAVKDQQNCVSSLVAETPRITVGIKEFDLWRRFTEARSFD